MCGHEDYPCCGCDEDTYTLPEDEPVCPNCGDDGCEFCGPADEEYDDSMDGDFDSAMTSAGFGTDEDYGYYGGEDY